MLSPDTLHPQVDNSAFVNAISQLALSAPQEAFAMLGKYMNMFEHFASAVYLPFDATKDYHPAFQGYKYSEFEIL